MPLKNKLEKDEVLDDLLIDGRKIIQNKNLYHFTSDSIRLAKFVKTKKSDRLVELCSGSGIIGIHLALQSEFSSLVMVEIQKQLADMSRRSIEMNGLENKIQIINSQLQNINKQIGTEKFDVVFCNPPFEKNDIKTENESEKIAKSEKMVNIFEICNEAGKLLKFSGSFYLCFPSTRLFELAVALNKNNFAVKDVELVIDAKGEARLALVHAVKGGKEFCKIKLFDKAGKL